MFNELYDYSEVQISAVMQCAREIQANLASEFPSFIKLIPQSEGFERFLIDLPSEFCKLHMPKYDETFALEGECGKEYRTNFITNTCILGQGWSRFSLAHKLLKGDVVVFQLVQPFKFKVYIVRSNDLAESDEAVGLLNSNVCAGGTDFGHDERYSRRCKKAGEKVTRLLPPEFCEKNLQKTLMVKNSSAEPAHDQNNNDNSAEDLISNGIEDFGLSGPFVDFKNFEVVVHGSIIDSELQEHLRTKYYALCCSRKSYLHHHLVRSVTPTLAIEIITGTVNIADAIRGFKLSTSRDDFVMWDKTIKAFELLGMDVEFLRVRLNRLVSLAFDPEKVAESKRLMETRLEQDRAHEEIVALESKLQELKQTETRLLDVIKALKMNKERHEVMLHAEANALW